MMHRMAWGQATPSMQQMMGKATRKKRSSGRKRGKKSTTATKIAKTAKRKSRAKPARLKKGSAAAKAWMAKIRKKRR